MTTSYSMIAMCDQTCTTERKKSDGTGLEANLSGVKCTDAMPLEPDTVQTSTLRSPREAKQIFSYSHQHTDGGTSVTQLPDIKEADELTLNSVTYIVRAVEGWKDGEHDTLRVIAEEVKA